MNEAEAKKRIQKLRDEISRLRNEYHTENLPNITDEVYDSLNKELKSLLEQFPQFYDPNAPENRVAGKPLEKFLKVRHEKRMYSIANVFSDEEFFAWEKRNLKLLPPNVKLDYFCELKLDGLAISLIYQKGKFERGVTRGDGEVGEDITQNLKMIEDIPLYLKAPFPEKIEVRGEAIMFKKVLERLNLRNEKEGKTPFANSRNAAAGSLRQLDPKLTKERHLNFIAYEITQIEGEKWKKEIEKHSSKHTLLERLGFKVDQYSKKISSSKEIPGFINHISKIREGLAFGIDGVVINVEDTKTHDYLGVVGKDPRGIIAYKYPAEKATTIVKDIKVNVGRTGVLTPLAIFEPTSVAGSVVSKATLHNFDQIERLDVRIGDTVVIEKAGDVIPKVTEVLTRLRTGKEKKFKIVDRCPVCGSKVEKREKVAYYCTNSKCSAKNERALLHFISAFGIYELGPKIIRRFKDEGLISDAADIFTLEKEDIVELERFGEKSAENIIREISLKKKVSFSRFLSALGILHVGEETARDLASHFGTLEKMAKASLEEINDIENIGPAVSQSIYGYFKEKSNLLFIEKLFKNGVVIEKEEKKKIGKFSGMTFVLTGTLEEMSREMAKEKIISFGGKVSSSVSKNTSYVVAGEEAGSKLSEAKRLNIKILTEKEFLKLIE